MDPGITGGKGGVGGKQPLWLTQNKKSEASLFALLENNHKEWLERIENGYFDGADEEALKSILSEMQV